MIKMKFVVVGPVKFPLADSEKDKGEKRQEEAHKLHSLDIELNKSIKFHT